MTRTKIGLGLAALGRPDYINIRQNSNIDKSKIAFKRNAFEVMDFAYKNGVRYFDTAPSYGLGEQFLLEWKNARQHKDLMLSTKWGYTYVANWELGYEGKHEIKEHSVSKLNEQWETSKALFPQLKIYQVHSATLESGILKDNSIHERLFQLKKQYGLQIGITTSGSNQSEILNSAKDIAVKNNLLFDSFQVTYNVFEQSTFNTLQQLKAMGKTVIIKEALANGRAFTNEHAKKQLEALSKTYDVGVDAIALRFVIDTLQPNVVLSGASTSNHLDQNLKALDFKLLSKDLELLKALTINSKAYWDERSDLTWN
ncbi:aldo/keto reductase [Psychroserpens burtonensis]|uniref:Aldo/keto reductase n=1 Tax=Psychroserpens burtonensis TaxID=49278 RepID=A0A5C7B7F2_9FLAO|nr:aldo/keto reductase [Psychroserpens burtonensis]TXE16707.1 aldo/keto reductase [Psychroserpens burtonensis]